MVCVDLKGDVIDYCKTVAKKVGFSGMNFICADVSKYRLERKPDLVISLHACDLATDMGLIRQAKTGQRLFSQLLAVITSLIKKLIARSLNL